MKKRSQLLEDLVEERPSCVDCYNFIPSVEGKGLCEVAIIEDLEFDYKELSNGDVEVDENDICTNFEPIAYDCRPEYEEDEERWSL